MSNIETPQNPLFLTRKQTCKLLCIGMSTLQIHINSKTLKAYQIGGKVLLKYKEVIEAVTELEK